MSSFNQLLNYNNQFIIAVKVVKCPVKEQYESEIAREAIIKAAPERALIDTGATNTSITQELADRLALIPIAKQLIMTAAEPYEASQYRVDIAIPVTRTVLQPAKENGKEVMKEIPTGEDNWAHTQHKVNSIPAINKDRGFDILLGTDILSQMHITIFNRQIIMSF